MQSTRTGWGLFAASVLYVFSLRNDIADLRTQVDMLHDNLSDREHKVSELREALEEANTKIRDAQSYVGSSYQEQQDALEDLEEVEEP